MAATEAQKRANKKYDQKNPEQRRIRTDRSAAKRFVKNYATREDLQELIDLFNSENPNADK